MARPSEYDFKMCEEICNELAEGNNIKRILDSKEEYPHWTTFRRWKSEHEELRTLYVNAQQDKAIALENELDDLKDSLMSGEIDNSCYNVVAQTIKWKMAKFYPKVFSDKVDVTSGGKEISTAPTAINIGIVKPIEE